MTNKSASIQLSHRQIMVNRIIIPLLAAYFITGAVMQLPWVEVSSLVLIFAFTLYCLSLLQRQNRSRKYLHYYIVSVIFIGVLITGVYAEAYKHVSLSSVTIPLIVLASGLVIISRIFRRRR